MMNLSSLSKIYLALALTAFVLVVTLGLGRVMPPSWIIAGIVIALALLMYSFWQTIKLHKNLIHINTAMKAAAKGDMEQRIVLLNDHGTVGAIARAINQNLDISDAFVRESRASLQAVSKGYYHRVVVERGMLGSFKLGAQDINSTISYMKGKFAEFHKLTDTFETQVKSVSTTVIASSSSLQTIAQTMAESVSSSRQSVHEINDNADGVSENVASVAQAAGELSSAINEIGQQSNVATDSNTVVISQTREAQQTIEGLRKSVSSVGEVINLIHDIAGQTNLLALNATIESARAGEAGRGFSVVAAEVKALATQTTDATTTITQHIEAIQKQTEEAVRAIETIITAINDMDGVAGAIAAAVEEQEAVTREICRNIGCAADSAKSVASKTGDVATTIDSTQGTAQGLSEASASLLEEANSLEGKVQRYLVQARKIA